MQLSRRSLLAGSLATIAARAQQPRLTKAVYAYVGCYTSAQRYARGDGIHAYRVDPETGAWAHIQRVPDLVNPSFLSTSRDQRFLYVAHGDEDYATSYSIDRDSGKLTPVSRAASGGRNGVHVAVAPNGRFIVIANYSTGSIAVLAVRDSGVLADAHQVVALPGQPGPHRVEQSSSHPHHIVFDPAGRFVAVPDKGLDRVFVFGFDSTDGKLTPTAQGAAIARAGSGPRHLAFHPTLPVVWVLNEINSTVATYHWESEPGHLRPVQILPSISPDYTGENTSSEIAVSTGGRFVYCSNRGHDSVALFAADPATGLLTSAGWEPTAGRTPRFIGFDPSHTFLYAANEQADTIVSWRIDSETGRLTRTPHVIRNASPVAIAFA